MIYNSNSNQSRACGGSNVAAMPFYQPMMASQPMVQPTMVQPMMASQAMAQPVMMQQPMMTSQAMTQPAMMQQPMMASQAMTQPAMMQQPMMTSQVVSQPAMMQQPMMTPQATVQQAVTQPNMVDHTLSYDQNMTQPNYQNAMISTQSMPLASYPAYGTASIYSSQVGMPTNQLVTTQTTQSVPVAQNQSTTTHHKKTTYVETYAQPCTNQEPVSNQITTTKTTTEKYPLTGNMVYSVQQQPKGSTMQDYNLYLLEKEYYGDDTDQPVYTKTQSYRDGRADGSPLISCDNIPLATSCVKMQSYQNLNDSTNTLQQGTAFADLYMPYTPRKVPVRGGNRYE